MRSVAIGLLYFVAAAITIRFTRFGGGAACLWVATALLAAELALHRKSDWPLPIACATLAGLVASALYGIGLAGAPLIAPFAIGEAVLAAFLLQRWNGRPDLGSLGGVIVFLGVMGVLAPALSGLGAAFIIAALTKTTFAANWSSWYLGHALGNITLTPLALLALSGEMFAGIAALRKRHKAEGVALVVLTIGVSILVFGQTVYPLLFLPLLPLTIAAFRFDRLGGAVAIVILASVGGGLSLAGNGPVQLIAGGPNERALFLQFYIASAVVMTLLISAELVQRKRLLVALRESEARYRMIADGSSDVILNLTVDGVIAYASPSIQELGGYDPAALLGTSATALVLADDRDMVVRAHRETVANPHSAFIVAYRGMTATGATIWCETHTRAITDEAGAVVGVVSAIRDISAHKSVQAELARAADTDPLTGVINRRAFDSALEARLADVAAGRGTGVCAVFDLDFFKQVNDRHGHAAGDQVLCVFAEVVRRSLRADDVIARIGGEEFAVILWNTNPAEAQAVCERVRGEVEDLSIAIGVNSAVRFTFSGGLAPIGLGQSRHHVLRRADDALYRAKRAGRNRLELAR